MPWTVLPLAAGLSSSRKSSEVTPAHRQSSRYPLAFLALAWFQRALEVEFGGSFHYRLLGHPRPVHLPSAPHPSSRDDPIHISCTAPKDFLGANFTLYRGGEVLQLLQAPKDQPGVTFTVTARDGGEAAGGNFSCQYGVVGEHGQPQLSDLSQPLQVSLPVSTWILVLSLSLAGAILLTGLVVIALTVRKVKIKNLQKQREQESYWAQINFTNTDMSFENSWFDISKKITQEEDPKAALDTPSCNSGKPTSQLSPEPPNLSTFRPCQ